MPLNHPGEVEHYAFFNTHLGTRCQSAGLRVQFHYNQKPGDQLVNLGQKQTFEGQASKEKHGHIVTF